MKNKRGFTLIEILVVIGILAALLTIVIVAIGNTKEKAQEKLLATKISTIEGGAKLWAQDNPEIFYENETYWKIDNSNDSSCMKLENEKIICEITLSFLAQEGYINYDKPNKIINPLDKSDISDKTVSIVYEKKQKAVTIVQADIITDEIKDEIPKIDKEYFLENREYDENEIINYLGLEWYVVKDNGGNVTLVLKNNYKKGAYGESTTYEGSMIFTDLNTNFINEGEVTKAINTRALKVQGTNENNNYYIRILDKEELSNNRPLTKEENGSSFWTKSKINENLYIGGINGELQTGYTNGIIGDYNLYANPSPNYAITGTAYSSAYSPAVVAKANEWYTNIIKEEITAHPDNTAIEYFSEVSDTKIGCKKIEYINISMCSGYGTVGNYIPELGASIVTGQKYWRYGIYDSSVSGYFKNSSYLYSKNICAKDSTEDFKTKEFTVSYIAGSNYFCDACNTFCLFVNEAEYNTTISLATEPIEYYSIEGDKVLSEIGYRPVITAYKK